MRPTQVHRDANGADPALALDLIKAIGAPNLAAELLACMSKPLAASHCTVFALKDSGQVEAIASASAVGEVATLAAIEYLRRGFDREDSNMVWLARRRPGRTSRLWIGHQFAEAVTNDEYRNVCYSEPGIRERLSLLCVFAEDYRIAVSFYRSHSYPAFDADDTEWLDCQSLLLATAVRRHSQLKPPLPETRLTRHRLMRLLSARERELIAHVLAGATTLHAAEQMGISLTTASTYRYRAFQRLGIRTHRELIAVLGAAR